MITMIRSMAGRIIMMVAYGIDVKPENDPHIETALKGLQAAEFGTTPEAGLFDTFPICALLVLRVAYHSPRSPVPCY